MLILARHAEQEVLIGDDIVVRVTRMNSETVWLGITAPKEVRVDRREVREAIKREEQRASSND